jgi:hypothetical protein
MKPRLFTATVLSVVLLAALAATLPGSSVGPSPSGMVAAATAQPAGAAWDPAALATSAAPSASGPAPRWLAPPPCPIACNPSTCRPPSHCKIVFHGCPPVCTT